jgi:hypothetical protein
MALFYKVYDHFRKEFLVRSSEGVFFSVSLFLLFIMQIDMFLYWDNLGFVFFSLLLARVVLKKKHEETRNGKHINGMQFQGEKRMPLHTLPS